MSGWVCAVNVQTWLNGCNAGPDIGIKQWTNVSAGRKI